VRYFNKRSNTTLVDIIVIKIETHFEKLKGYIKNKARIDKYVTGIAKYGRSLHNPGISSVCLIRMIIICATINEIIAIIDNHPNIENKVKYQF
jgi:hypothetical protein